MPRLKSRVDKRDSRLYGVISEYSHQHHIKRPQLAKACGVSETTLSKKINNPGCFTLSEIRAICEYLRIPTDERNFI